MQIQTTQAVGEVLDMWAKSRAISVKQLVGELLSEACKHFLQGKQSALSDMKYEGDKE